MSFRQFRTNPSQYVSNFRGRSSTSKGWPSTAVSTWMNGGLFGGGDVDQGGTYEWLAGYNEDGSGSIQTYTFSSISSDYRELIVRICTAASPTDYVPVGYQYNAFNNDEYFYNDFWVSNNSISGSENISSAHQYPFVYQQTGDSGAGAGFVNVSSPSIADKHSVTAWGANAYGGWGYGKLLLSAATWNGTGSGDAIDELRIMVTAGSQTFEGGTTINLFGVKDSAA